MTPSTATRLLAREQKLSPAWRVYSRRCDPSSWSSMSPSIRSPSWRPSRRWLWTRARPPFRMWRLCMVWIRTIDPEDADGRLAEAYGWQGDRLRRPTEFNQLGSLDGDVVHARLVLYRASENVPSRLSATQKQLIAYLTSILNATPHCAALSRTQLSASGADALVCALDK